MNKQSKLATHQWMLTLALSAFLTMSLVGCKPSPPPTAPPTLEPTLTQPPTAPPEPPPPTPSPPQAPVTEPPDEITVPAGKRIAVSASATGADGYRWELQGDGEISGTEGDTILYTAPGPDQVSLEGTMALLTVVAHNEWGESPGTTLVIDVPPVSRTLVSGKIAIRPAEDTILVDKDCPIPGATGELHEQGTIDLTGLRPGQAYRLSLNGWREVAPNDELCEIDCTPQGEGFWDFDTDVIADENGEVSQRPLQGILPPSVDLYTDTMYKVKFFVKEGPPRFCTALGYDEFWFTVEQLQ